MEKAMEIELETGILTIDIEHSDYPLDDLLGFAARNNAKRGFLFLSKVLGKHWPVKPSVMQDIHKKLALKLSTYTFNTVPYFIGMAETATALGHGVFEEFCEYTTLEALYSHTSRYNVQDESTQESHTVLNFSEEHSHATDQLLYIPLSQKAQKVLLNAQSLVLIDDEMSTGKTFLNLIKQIQKFMPQLQTIFIVTLVDMTASNALSSLQEQVSCKIETISLLKGSFTFKAKKSLSTLSEQSKVKSVGNGLSKADLLPKEGGRMGVFPKEWKKLSYSLPLSSTILVLGTGEFMYEAYRLALELEIKGYEVYFQATSRSPILLGQDIHSILNFTDNYGECIDNFLYNVKRDQYNTILLCYETKQIPQEHNLAHTLGAQICFLEQ